MASLGEIGYQAFHGIAFVDDDALETVVGYVHIDVELRITLLILLLLLLLLTRVLNRTDGLTLELDIVVVLMFNIVSIVFLCSRLSIILNLLGMILSWLIFLFVLNYLSFLFISTLLVFLNLVFLFMQIILISLGLFKVYLLLLIFIMLIRNFVVSIII